MSPTPLPSGTVTFLFTDVEGSTRLLQEHGPAYADLLAEHRRVIREAYTRHRGVEVDTQGDAFFVAFPGGRRRRRRGRRATGLEGGPIRVRMGLHTGEPVLTDEVCRHRRPPRGADRRLRARRPDRRLRDDPPPPGGRRSCPRSRRAPLERSDRRRAPFPARRGRLPATPDARRHQSALVSIPLIGRERELDELVGLLSNGTRLVTVTGPGGTGKTRLALQAAAELVGSFRDGVFWTSLAGLTDPELLPSELAQTIGAPDDLTGFLRGRELLLLLDNFEHLLDAAPLVSDVLGACPEVRVLVTSRAPLV